MQNTINQNTVNNSLITKSSSPYTTALGASSLQSSVGDHNVSLGYYALRLNSSGTNNVAMGSFALQNNLIGTNNVAVGYQALSANVTGYHTAIGYQALSSNTTGVSNTAVGYKALNSNTIGSSNTSFGQESLSNLVTGTNNVAIGYQAGFNYSGNETNNIVIGANVLGTAAEINSIRIGSGTTSCYINGIAGVTVSNPTMVTINSATGQLGSVQIPSAVVWSVITASQTLVIGKGYFTNGGSTLSLALPASSAIGDSIAISNMNSSFGWTITQGAGQNIVVGNTQSTVGAGGSISSQAIGDTLFLVCNIANIQWISINGVGNLTII